MDATTRRGLFASKMDRTKLSGSTRDALLASGRRARAIARRRVRVPAQIVEGELRSDVPGDSRSGITPRAVIQSPLLDRGEGRQYVGVVQAELEGKRPRLVGSYACSLGTARSRQMRRALLSGLGYPKTAEEARAAGVAPSFGGLPGEASSERTMAALSGAENPR